jgi:hypothetical protein
MELKIRERNPTFNVGKSKAETLAAGFELSPMPDEVALWKNIDKAEFPIRTTLKRLNRITKIKFPEYKLQTTSSCSGHIKEDNSINLGDKDIYIPHVMFYSRSKMHLPEMSPYLKGIFKQAVDKTNKKFQDKVITVNEEASANFTTYMSYFDGDYCMLPPKGVPYRKFPNQKTYAILYYFPILRQKNVFPVLEQFWTNLEQVLTGIDGFDIHTPLKKEDFVKKTST